MLSLASSVLPHQKLEFRWMPKRPLIGWSGIICLQFLQNLDLEMHFTRCQHHNQWSRIIRLSSRMPPSPLLFALTIEPLSLYLKASNTFSGITRLQGYNREFKLSLYADDLLLYVSDSIKVIPAILSFSHRFRSFPGYKANSGKSECFQVKTFSTDLRIIQIQN